MCDDSPLGEAGCTCGSAACTADVLTADAGERGTLGSSPFAAHPSSLHGQSLRAQPDPCRTGGVSCADRISWLQMAELVEQDAACAQVWLQTEPCAPLTAAQGEPRTVGGRGVPCSVRSMRSSFLSAARIVTGETNRGGKGQEVGRGATLGPVTSVTGHARTPDHTAHLRVAFSNARAEVSRELAERCRARGACALARLSVGHVSRVLGACAHLWTPLCSPQSCTVHDSRHTTTRARELSHTDVRRGR